MSTRIAQIAGGLAVAVPLAAFALFGTADGSLFGNVASAGYGNGQDKVTICHKDKNTLTVAAPAVKAHLNHGDTLGTCSPGSPE